ncbi:MAG: HmuY family protein [Bacteroidota bacterium]
MPFLHKYTAIGFLMLLVGCKSSQEVVEHSTSLLPAPTLVNDINLSDGKVLYSLRTQTIIPGTAEDTDAWDIAFERVSVYANKHGELLTLEFDAVNHVPDTWDNAKAVAGQEIDDPEGSGWYNYNTSTHVVSARPGKTFLVETPAGTFAKVQILNYYKQNEPQKGAPRFISFRYVHQADGSKSLRSAAGSGLQPASTLSQ